MGSQTIRKNILLKKSVKLLSTYTKFNNRRKPELLSPSTYSLVNYREAEKVVEDYRKIALKAEDIFNKLPAEMHDAFYQIGFISAKACAHCKRVISLQPVKMIFIRRQGTCQYK